MLIARPVDVDGRLAAIVDSSDAVIFSTDLQDRITAWNVGAARLYGYNASEIIGQPAPPSANTRRAITTIRRSSP